MRTDREWPWWREAAAPRKLVPGERPPLDFLVRCYRETDTGNELINEPAIGQAYLTLMDGKLTLRRAPLDAAEPVGAEEGRVSRLETLSWL